MHFENIARVVNEQDFVLGDETVLLFHFLIKFATIFIKIRFQFGFLFLWWYVPSINCLAYSLLTAAASA